MTTKWEFLDHPDNTESPYLYDDQTPPSYVQRTSAGVWSLVKTGNIANREDQLAENNWDYIVDNGTTVSFYFKHWDTDGYWSGPYLRATWPSNSSGVTITVTNINNGNFYLKQPISGPTVTSITADEIFVPNDTVSNTDFTLLKDASAYANTNISLNGPRNIALNTGLYARGYDYYINYNGTGLYTTSIDSKSYEEFYYDDSWTSSPSSGRSTNSNRILNVLATIPSTTTFNFSTSIWNYTAETFQNNSRNMFFRMYKIGSNASPTTDLYVYFYVYGDNYDIKARFVGYTYEGNVLTGFTSGPTIIVGAQATMTHTFTVDGTNQIIDVPDWVYSDEPEGDGYVAPVTTTSNGGGKRRRYPIISTNLFDRQKSIFSIGMTHKDETLF